MQQTQTWPQFSSIFLGMTICLSDFMVGQVLMKEYGPYYAFGAILIGNFLLFLLALVKAKMGYQLKLNTIQATERYLGKYGSIILAFIFLAVVVSWFGIELNLAAESIQKSFELITGLTFIPIIFFNVLLGILITILVAFFELAGIEKLSRYAMPLFLVTLILMLINAYNTKSAAIISTNNSWHGISVIFATAIAAVIDLPVFFKSARSFKDAAISSGLFLLIMLPAIEAIGAYLALKNPSSGFVDILTNSSNIYWQLWVGLFLILAGWASNCANVFSGAFIIEQITVNKSYKFRSLLVGFLGIIISCLTILLSFEFIVSFMGIIVSSMGAVVAVNYLTEMISPKSLLTVSYKTNQAILTVGTIFGWSALFGWIKVSGFEVIDAFLISATVTALSKIFQYIKQYIFNNRMETI
jgi:cytosine permease